MSDTELGGVRLIFQLFKTVDWLMFGRLSHVESRELNCRTVPDNRPKAHALLSSRSTNVRNRSASPRSAIRRQYLTQVVPRLHGYTQHDSVPWTRRTLMSHYLSTVIRSRWALPRAILTIRASCCGLDSLRNHCSRAVGCQRKAFP